MGGVFPALFEFDKEKQFDCFVRAATFASWLYFITIEKLKEGQQLVIDFSMIDFSEQPVLVLQNADGTALQTLGYAFNLSGEFNYNEISTISFDIPAYVDGVKTPGYDDVIGLRMIDMVGWGRFVLVNPKVSGDGIKEIKSCKAYSLEYELVRKKMSLQNGTYNFWNSVAPAETVIDIILSYLPSWSVGEIDASLEGKYRTFEVSNVNIYDFIKSTLQKTYGCVFDFDTYNRRINVKSVESEVTQAPVYISLQNLAKQIDVSEDTEHIVTVLDVNGAEGVTIRSVNPTGTNKIYNLDYLIETNQIPADIAEGWLAWKAAFEENQEDYHDIMMQKVVKTSEVVAAEYELQVMKDEELATLEVERSVIVESLAVYPDNSDYKAALAAKTEEIESKKEAIEGKKNALDALKAAETTLQSQLNDINTKLHFTDGDFWNGGAFTQEQYKVLDRYFIEDSIEDSNFVTQTVENYSDDSFKLNTSSGRLTISGYDSYASYGLYGAKISGGKFELNMGDGSITASVVYISANVGQKWNSQENEDGTTSMWPSDRYTYMITGYLSDGEIVVGEETQIFNGGCIVMSGECDEPFRFPALPGRDPLWSLSSMTGNVYFSRCYSAYEQYGVEWELYEYGNQVLEKLSKPSYSFDVSTANFFSLDEFNSFAKKTMLGYRMYLELSEDDVLEPVLLSVQLDFERPSSLKLEFGDKFTRTGGAADLVDLLEQSVSMGKTVDTSRFNYNSFIDSGASTAVRDYMNSALDASKNAILSGSDMAVSWDASGIHCRKYVTGGSGYEPEELAIINNNIVFTTDNWQTAKMAIGKVINPNLVSESNTTGESWGIVADHIVGTLLAGENLVIESVKKDGSNAVFKVDADGAVLYNSKFEIANDNRHILMDPDVGFALGKNSLIKSDGTLDTDKAKFWVDTDGNVHFKGTLEGANGVFSGSLSAATGTFAGELSAATGTFSGELSAATGTFSGELKAATGTFAGDLSAAKGSFSGDITGASGTFSGVVQASDFLDSSGNSMMQNGKFDSNYLDLGGIIIDGDTGEITFPSGSVTTESLSDDVKQMIDSAGDAADVKDDLDGLSTILFGKPYNQIGSTKITSSRIDSPTIWSNILNTGVLNLYTNGSTIAGNLSMTGAQTASFATELFSHGALRLIATQGDCYIANAGGFGKGQYLQLNDSSDTIVVGGGSLLPNSGNTYSLGSTTTRWANVYAVNANISGTLTAKSLSITDGISASVMTGASATTAGKSGSVPTPSVGDHVNFLRGDGKWAAPVAVFG